MSEVDDQIARATAAMERISDGYRTRSLGGPGGQRARASLGKRIARIAVADAAILVAAMVIGFVAPIGLFGALLVMALLVAVTITLAVWPPERAPSAERLVQADLKVLPAQTERWLAAQRPALPAPAVMLVDQIGVRLGALSPQLAQLDEGTQAAADVRKLIGEQLPAFVGDYGRVPASLRTTPRNGRTPDAELVDGLKLIEREIAEMTSQLAQGDLDSFATRGRFLEMKYRDGDTPA